MKFNRKWLWLIIIIPIIMFSLFWLSQEPSPAVSTVLLAIKGAITDGNLVKFSGVTGVGEDAGITSSNVEDAITKKHSQNTDTAAGGEWDFGAHSAGFTLQTAAGDGDTLINWTLGNKVKFTFGAQNETITFTDPANPGGYQMIIVQDGTGNRTITWSGMTIKWHTGAVPALSTGANAEDIISFIWDGTSYYGQASCLFATP